MSSSSSSTITTTKHHHHHFSLQLLALLLTLLVTVASAATSSTNDLSSDRQALLDFAAAVPHPRSTTRRLSWLSNSSLCSSWSGITCSYASSSRVISLHLPAAGFSGSIPANTLGRLDALAFLSLRSNALYGPLPPDLLSLPSLRYVYLQNNNFSGDIPSSLSPQLTFLDLSFNSLQGTLPPALNNLSRLVALNLNNNSLAGPIPDLGALSSGLEQLNLSNNHLNGSIPRSLRRFPASSFRGNSQLCGIPLIPCLPFFSPSPSPSPPAPPARVSRAPSAPQPTILSPPPTTSPRHHKLISRGSTVAIAIGASAVMSLMGLASWWLCCTNHMEAAADTNKTIAFNGIEKSINNNTKDDNGDEARNNKLVFLQGVPTIHNFDLDDLLRASAEVLGKGTYGATYKVILEDGTHLAVKRLKQVVVAKADFLRQMEDVGSVNPHPNVVPIRAYYYSKDEKLLVYDYVPFGNLNTLLHGKREIAVDWETRLQIVLGAARGIVHIQHSAAALIHGNIKSSNVLVTNTLAGCISDFGLAPIAGFQTSSGGYQAPEVCEFHGKYTQKSDVYSFGVVLLETLTGKAAAAGQYPGVEVDLPRWVQSVVREKWTTEVFDVELIKDSENNNNMMQEEMVQLLQIALACVTRLPETRPTMDQVVHMIQHLPRQPTD